MKNENRHSAEFSFREISKVQPSFKSPRRFRLRPALGKNKQNTRDASLASIEGPDGDRSRQVTKNLAQPNVDEPGLVSGPTKLESWAYWRQQSVLRDATELGIRLLPDYKLTIEERGHYVRRHKIWEFLPTDALDDGYYKGDIAAGDMLKIVRYTKRAFLEANLVGYFLVIERSVRHLRVIILKEELKAWLLFSRFNLWRILRYIQSGHSRATQMRFESQLGYSLTQITPTYFLLLILRLADRRVVSGMKNPSVINYRKNHDLGSEQTQLVEWISRTQPKVYFEKILEQISKWPAQKDLDASHGRAWVERLVKTYVSAKLRSAAGRAGAAEQGGII